jgi:hypothetical protein
MPLVSALKQPFSGCSVQHISKIFVFQGPVSSKLIAGMRYAIFPPIMLCTEPVLTSSIKAIKLFECSPPYN